MKKEELNQIESLRKLKEILKDSKNKIFAQVKSVSSSGMSRIIKFYIVDKNYNFKDITFFIANCLNQKLENKYNGLKVVGCGMDMIFNTLYNINSYAMHYKIIKVSKNKDKRYLQYHGLINTNYNYFN